MTFPSADALLVAAERYGVLEGGKQTLDRIVRALDRVSRWLPQALLSASGR
jgi:hypothetical protein